MAERGTVKFFNDERGYGFIRPVGGGKEVFVHFTGIQGKGRRSLIDGQDVEYDVEENDRGPKAVNVRAIGQPHRSEA